MRNTVCSMVLRSAGGAGMAGLRPPHAASARATAAARRIEQDGLTRIPRFITVRGSGGIPRTVPGRTLYDTLEIGVWCPGSRGVGPAEAQADSGSLPNVRAVP